MTYIYIYIIILYIYKDRDDCEFEAVPLGKLSFKYHKATEYFTLFYNTSNPAFHTTIEVSKYPRIKGSHAFENPQISTRNLRMYFPSEGILFLN